MRLRDLDARFIGQWSDKSFRHLDSIDGAQGVMFQCPKCAQGAERAEDGGFMGVHYVICWFTNPRNAPRVPDDVSPKPGRWQVAARCTGLDDLTFDGPGSFSVLLTSGCNWHGYVKNGEAE